MKIKTDIENTGANESISAVRKKTMRQSGMAVWFTGLPGSGKTSVAACLENMLLKANKPAYLLDEENLRLGLNSEAGLKNAAGGENVRRTAETALLMADAGLITLVSTVSPYNKLRRLARERISAAFPFIEVYISTDIKICAKRDKKGMYQKAFLGLINDFTGVSAPYEPPENPEIIIDTEKLTAEEAAAAIFRHIKKIEKEALKNELSPQQDCGVSKGF
ncbi:MAG: adenylyl-sulfate kinase [Oscillospiraceae bacterium]|nr:adenylyl-sulfate kinase [Oscillospiraceae bacterium]